MSISRFLAFLWFLAEVAVQASLGGFWGIVHKPSPAASSGSDTLPSKLQVHYRVEQLRMQNNWPVFFFSFFFFFPETTQLWSSPWGSEPVSLKEGYKYSYPALVPLAPEHSVATPLKPMTCVYPSAPRSLWKSAFVKNKSKTVLMSIAVRSRRHFYADLLSGLSDFF